MIDKIHKIDAESKELVLLGDLNFDSLPGSTTHVKSEAASFSSSKLTAETEIEGN